MNVGELPALFRGVMQDPAASAGIMRAAEHHRKNSHSWIGDG